MAEYLQVLPHKLVLRPEVGKQAQATLSLQNPTDERLAFKVKTTAPLKFSVKPAAGFLEAGGSAQLTIGMAAPRERPAGGECKDRFLVQALALGPEVPAATSELFKERAADVSSTKLKVVLLEPKDGAKGSGAGSSGAGDAAAPATATPCAAPAVPAAAELDRQRSGAAHVHAGVLAAFAAAPAAAAPGGHDAAAAAPAPAKYSASLRKAMERRQAQQAQQLPPQQPSQQQQQRQGRQLASPASSALVSHHTRLAPGAAPAVVDDTAPIEAAAPPTSVPAAAESAQPAAAVPSGASRRGPTRGARLEDVLAAQRRAAQRARAATQQGAAEAEAVPAPAAAAPCAHAVAAPAAELHGREVMDAGVQHQQHEEELKQQEQEVAAVGQLARARSRPAGGKARRRRSKAAVLDSDYEPEEKDAAVASDEKRWVEEQRQLRGLSGSPGEGSGGEDEQRRSGGARSKQGSAGGGAGGDGVAGLAGRLEAGARLQPRTKASLTSGGSAASLRLTFRAADGGQRLAVVALRSGAPLQRAMQEVAARCLEGGGAELAAALTFRLGGRVLAAADTPKSAGLHDGDTVLVGF